MNPTASTSLDSPSPALSRANTSGIRRDELRPLDIELLPASDDPLDRDIRMLIRSRDVYALSETRAAEILGRVADAVAQWPEVAAETGIAAAEIASMASAFSETQLMHAREHVAAHTD